ncbi:MAG: CDP-alcohol phosphatidyltransferase family protein [Christensenellaceae bacterium]
MIGFYNYTVVLTYTGLGIAFLGITMASSGNFKIAMICLMAAEVCDGLDGPVARAKKQRTESEKLFGIQIDSLCDLVSFGVLPAYIGYRTAIALMPENTAYHIAALCVGIFFVLCATIRLAYFNVTEEERLRSGDHKKRSSYQGLPVVYSATVLPTVYLIKTFVSAGWYIAFILCALFLTGGLFIINFRVPKPMGKQIIWVWFLSALLLMAVCCSK